ncbi:gyrI-like small molecule binding domain protein [Escherichia coli 3-475-03_S4_C1]|nr:gyrI-like small molecule binding domain protein [Escherichia coli 3-475-03_S4_C1]
MSAILSTLFQSKISHRNLATADATSSFCSEISCMCLWENTFANEGFVVPPFLSGSPRNLCLILHSLCIFIHSSHSAANLKSYSAALPREYRHRDYWDLANIFPSFLIRQQQKTECRLINFPETPIFGNSFKYDIEVSNKSPDEEVKLRRHHLARCMKNFKTDIYFVSTFEPSTKSVDLLTVETFAGTVCEYADMPKEWTTTRGLYASFRYEGNWENYPDWVRNIYLIELPARGLARVNGSDIERFYYNEDFVEKDGNDVVCEIFIPVRPV